MRTFFLILLFALLTYTPLAKCSGSIDLGTTISGLNELLQVPENVEIVGENKSIIRIPQLENQARLCARWTIQNPTNPLSPKFKNKDPNVLFHRERFYKRHDHPHNAPHDKRPAGVDLWSLSIHYANYDDEEQVKAAACSSLLNDDAWLIKGVKQSGLSGMGGYVEESEDYFLVVFAFKVHLYDKIYLERLPLKDVPPLSLEPPISNSVDDDGFKEVPQEEVVEVDLSLERVLPKSKT